MPTRFASIINLIVVMGLLLFGGGPPALAKLSSLNSSELGFFVPNMLTTRSEGFEAQTQPSSDTSVIDIEWSVEDDRSIVYVVHEDSTKEKLVDEPFEKLIYPQFSIFTTLAPNKQFVTYVTADNISLSNAQLWIIDTDGTNRRLLATFPSELWIVPIVWSPDSSQILFTESISTPNPGIHFSIIDIVSGEQIDLLNTPGLIPDLFYGSHPAMVEWTEQGIILTDYVTSEGSSIVSVVSPVNGEVISIEDFPAPDWQSLSTDATLPCGVSQFSQNDLQWQNIVMQTCGETIGQSGCAVTSTAMNFRYFNVNTSPSTLNSCLGNSACPIIWGTAAGSCSEGKASFTCSGCGWLDFSWSTISIPSPK